MASKVRTYRVKTLLDDNMNKNNDEQPTKTTRKWVPSPNTEQDHDPWRSAKTKQNTMDHGTELQDILLV